MKGQVVQKVGRKCWQATVVLMLSTLAVTHTSPEGSTGILGLSRHMTNCSVLLTSTLALQEVIYSLQETAVLYLHSYQITHTD